MFCCCPQDTNPLEESSQKPNSTPASANAHTGKGVNSSSQSRNAEADTDKSKISAANLKRTPVTEQPGAQAKSVSASSEPQAKAETKKETPEQLVTKPIQVSDIKPQIISTAETAAAATSKAFKQSTASAEAAAKSVSVISVARQNAGNSQPLNLDTKSMPNISQLNSVHTELDQLDKAIGEAESKSNLEAEASVPKLANQLKALTSQVKSAVGRPGVMADQAFQVAVSRLEAVATRLEALAARSSGVGNAAGGDSDVVSPSVLAYDDIVSGPLAKFLALSSDIGGDVRAQASFVREAFDAQRIFLAVASKSKQPSQNDLIELLKPSSSKLVAVQDFRENNRRSEFFNHLSAVSESIAALGWVTIAPAPGPFVKEMSDAGTFYTNRVLKDYKEKDAKHVEWSRAWISTLTELQAYIKQFHTTGLSWNPQGGEAKAAQISGAAVLSPSTAAAPAPPPPPGPPPPPDMSASNTKDDDLPGRAALFAELNKGEDVTKGLKRVTDDMKTHKNPGLRQGPAPFKAPGAKTSPQPVSKPQVAPASPPLTELQGKKWVIEYHKNNKGIVIAETELKQSVYAFRCEGCTIQIKGKINSIILDSCKKTAIVFDDLVSSLEFVNCQSMQAQVTGKMPTVSIDKTDGCQVYLSKDSLNCEIVTAKSSEMNILVPQGDGDYKEFALPEQFKSLYNGSTMVTTATESA